MALPRATCVTDHVTRRKGGVSLVHVWDIASATAPCLYIFVLFALDCKTSTDLHFSDTGSPNDYISEKVVPNKETK